MKFDLKYLNFTQKLARMVMCSSVLFAMLYGGCKNIGKSPDTSTPTSGGKYTVTTIRQTTIRDMSINKNNAYNDIFLDSPTVEKFIKEQKLSDTLADGLRGFYNARNYEYAWFSSKGLIEQALSFHSLYCTGDDTDAVNKSLEKRLDILRIDEDSTIQAADPVTIKTELQITQRFIQYAIEHYNSRGITASELGTFIPAKKTSVLALADSVLADNVSNRSYDALNDPYRLLKGQLRKYTDIAKRGGWPVITTSAKKYSKGNNAPAIALIKQRLLLTGELTTADSTGVYNDELENAVKAYQQHNGLKQTGIVTPDVIKIMNVPAKTIVEKILVNLQRMRWMPSRPEGRLIIVNIPEFELYVFNGKSVLFQMDVVVGKEGHNTTQFSGNLNQIVFSPYWNVPPSIVKKEILPAIAKDKDYLAKKDMEITGNEGGLPVIRQLPGEKNSLGKVKFLFPNSFNIYLHDTPQKDLFQKTVRDFSHGCIRLSDPVKLADYLLENQPPWTPERIDSAMNSGKEQFVKLKNPIPVIITYYTAWVDETGLLHFADDIYQHDIKIAEKMFNDPQ